MTTSRSREVSAMRARCRGDGWVGWPFAGRVLADLRQHAAHSRMQGGAGYISRRGQSNGQHAAMRVWLPVTSVLQARHLPIMEPLDIECLSCKLVSMTAAPQAVLSAEIWATRTRQTRGQRCGPYQRAGRPALAVLSPSLAMCSALLPGQLGLWELAPGAPCSNNLTLSSCIWIHVLA